MSGQKGSNGLSMQIMPTHLDYADDIYEDDDDYDSEDDDEYYEGGKTKISPRKQKKKFHDICGARNQIAANGFVSESLIGLYLAIMTKS